MPVAAVRGSAGFTYEYPSSTITYSSTGDDAAGAAAAARTFAATIEEPGCSLSVEEDVNFAAVCWSIGASVKLAFEGLAAVCVSCKHQTISHTRGKVEKLQPWYMNVHLIIKDSAGDRHAAQTTHCKQQCTQVQRHDCHCSAFGQWLYRSDTLQRDDGRKRHTRAVVSTLSDDTTNFAETISKKGPAGASCPLQI